VSEWARLGVADSSPLPLALVALASGAFAVWRWIRRWRTVGDVLQMLTALAILGACLGWRQPDEGGPIGVALGLSLVGTAAYWSERADPDRDRRHPPPTPTPRGVRVARAGVVIVWVELAIGAILMILYVVDRASGPAWTVGIVLGAIAIAIQVGLMVALTLEVRCSRRVGPGSKSG
jgi:hypothetical protein